MNLTKLELYVQNSLLEAGLQQGSFDVISAPVDGGSCNLTFVVAGLIRTHHDLLIKSLGEATADNEYNS